MTSHKDLVVLGDSTTEVFDYIFGDNPQYHPFWASSWSARGLSGTDNVAYIKTILADIPKTSIIFLNFGTVDIDFNLRYKIKHENFSDYDVFVSEMVVGIVSLRDLLVELGFEKKNIYATCIAPPIRLECEYWSAINLPDLSTKQRGRLHLLYANGLKKSVQVIDLYTQLSDHFRFAGELEFYPALSGMYTRHTPDHHQDYTKTQFAIWQAIRQIEGMIPRLPYIINRLYPHHFFNIPELRIYGMSRPKTVNKVRFSDCWQFIVDEYQIIDGANYNHKAVNLLIGDDVFVRFPNDYLGNNILNRSFSYAQWVDYSVYFEQLVEKYQPKNIYIHLGMNGLMLGKTNDAIIGEFNHILTLLLSKNMNARVHIVSILPTIKYWYFKDRIIALNSQMQDYVKSKENLFFIDVYSRFLNNNKFPDSSFYNDDGWRLTDLGYKVLASSINFGGDYD